MTAACFFGRLKPYAVHRCQNSPVQYPALLKNPVSLRLFYAGFKVFIEAFRLRRIQQSAAAKLPGYLAAAWYLFHSRNIFRVLPLLSPV
jgi:hypothetical protein